MPITTTDIQTLSEELDRGLALPTAWYTDPAIAELEQQRIFRHSWQYVGRTDQVQEVGDYVTAQVGTIPVVLVRAPEGIQGLVNVCRHRRHEVMSGAGNRRSLQCPYHAWTYELDGRLRTAPRSERERDFCKEDYPLLPLQTATWGRWIFANPDPSAPPLTEILGELPEILAGSGMDVDRLQLWGRDDWVSGANWKIPRR